MKQLNYTLRLRLTDEAAEHKVFFGPGVAELMDWINKEHQMSRACRNMGLSYSKGWRILKCAEETWGTPLVEGHSGGERGGTMVLTEEGKRLLARYKEMEQELDCAAQQLFDRYFGTGGQNEP